MKYKGVIFDLDGVIVDTAKYHYWAWKRLAQELGFDFTEEDNERLKGVSRMRSLEILLEVGQISRSEEEKVKLAAQKNQWYVAYIEKMSKDEILPGVLDFINFLKAKKIKCAIGSASKNTRLILQRLEITACFDAVSDGTVIAKAKPDPEVFIKASQMLGLKQEQCIVFEDAKAGVEAALRGGMYCVGIGDQNKLKAAHLILDGFTDPGPELYRLFEQ